LYRSEWYGRNGIVAALPPPSALIFGALIAATDPVAVIAMFNDDGVTGRLRLLVESESLSTTASPPCYLPWR
jgi:NhaP-type Na+/H+ or K+/H+ antiporter